MAPVVVDREELIGRWRLALDAAQTALRAARYDLPQREVAERSRALAEERAATVRALEGLASDRHWDRMLVRLVASPWDTRRLLSLPSDTAACVFDLDGVLAGSAAIHTRAWREVLDGLLSRRIDRGAELARFAESDYRAFLHARPRLEGIHRFLASRGLSLPAGSPADAPGTETVWGLANGKGEALRRQLEASGLRAFEGARLYLELARDAGVRCAVVSPSATAGQMLEEVRLATLVDDRIDGDTMRVERLRPAPAPDTLLAACRHLGVEPGRAAVFETTPDGVAAGRDGGFELVIGIAQAGGGSQLRECGADLVVAELAELLEAGLS